jgi:uncharacterized membrane protein
MIIAGLAAICWGIVVLLVAFFNPSWTRHHWTRRLGLPAFVDRILVAVVGVFIIIGGIIFLALRR